MVAKTLCGIPGCRETMSMTHHTLRPICNTHWGMIPPALQQAITAARHHGPRKQAEEMIKARRWLAEQETTK